MISPRPIFGHLKDPEKVISLWTLVKKIENCIKPLANMYVKVFWSKFSSSMKLQLKWVSWKCDDGVDIDDDGGTGETAAAQI